MEMNSAHQPQTAHQWEHLYQAARKVQHARVISPFIEFGSVSAALLTEPGTIYTDICVDTACAFASLMPHWWGSDRLNSLKHM